MRTDSVDASTFVFLAPSNSQVITMTTSPSANYDLTTVKFVNDQLLNYASKSAVTTLEGYFTNNKLPISNLSISNSASGT